MIRALLASLLLFACSSGPRPAPRTAAPPPQAPDAPASQDPFVARVRPALVKSCAPCHEKGGKMYATMPFDDPSTIRSHEAGVRRRLKGEDLAALEAWLTAAPRP